MTVIDFICKQTTGLSFEALVHFCPWETEKERQVREWATKMMLRKSWKRI